MQLRSFSSGSKKLGNISGLKKLVENREGLRYSEISSHVAISSKITIVSASVKIKCFGVTEPKKEDIL